MLAQGTFTAKITDVDTKVSYKILASYEVVASFRNRGHPYEFRMLKWIKTKEDTKKAVSTFDLPS